MSSLAHFDTGPSSSYCPLASPPLNGSDIVSHLDLGSILRCLQVKEPFLHRKLCRSAAFVGWGARPPPWRRQIALEQMNPR